MQKNKVLILLACLSVAIGLIMPNTANAATNLAYLMPVTVNSSYSIYGGANATDGNYDTYWNAGDWGYTSDKNWLTVDLGTIFNVNRIKLVAGYNPPPFIYADYRNLFNLYASNDNSTWSLLYSGTLYDNVTGRFDDRTFSPLTMRYVKYEEVGGDRRAFGEYDIHWSHLAEMEVYGVDSVIPEPASLSLLGLGLLGLLGLRKKEKR